MAAEHSSNLQTSWSCAQYAYSDSNIFQKKIIERPFGSVSLIKEFSWYLLQFILYRWHFWFSGSKRLLLEQSHYLHFIKCIPNHHSSIKGLIWCHAYENKHYSQSFIHFIQTVFKFNDNILNLFNNAILWPKIIQRKFILKSQDDQKLIPIR